MIDFMDVFQNKLRFFAVGTLVIVCILLLPFLPHLLWIDPKVQAAGSTSANDSPNAITRGMFNGADGLDRVASSTEQTVSNSFRAAANTVASSATKSGRFVANSVVSGVSLTGRAADGSVRFVARGTATVFRSMANTSVVGAVIRPGDKMPVAVAEKDEPILAQAGKSNPIEAVNSQPAAQPQNEEASWPIRGTVTTEFGVPHWPWQPTHTGIDISDQKPSGTTPIHAFKSGVVKETIRSRSGLGNHVILEHSGGLTSIYAHLSAITVKIGQEVNESTILGYAGSTGASTGTHLHFEIRLTGQPVDPRKYISGQP